MNAQHSWHVHTLFLHECVQETILFTFLNNKFKRTCIFESYYNFIYIWHTRFYNIIRWWFLFSFDLSAILILFYTTIVYNIYIKVSILFHNIYILYTYDSYIMKNIRLINIIHISTLYTYSSIHDKIYIQCIYIYIIHILQTIFLYNNFMWDIHNIFHYK
jgi:hypothetical protein